MTNNGKNRNDARAGLTLIELLVVGTIIMILTVVSLPIVKPALDSQLTKSGAQIVSTYLNRAKNRAMLTGRPCGVRFTVWDGTEQENYRYEENDAGTIAYYYSGGASLIMRQVEVPPVYSGMFGSATVNVGDKGECQFLNDRYVDERLKKESGAKIQFGGSGPYYSFRSGTKRLRNNDLYDAAVRNGQSFKILFGPKATMAAPITLPRGSAVDLDFSGIGNAVRMTVEHYAPDVIPPNFKRDVTIMFAPDGSVDSVNGSTPTEPIHFLIGRWDQISAVRTDGDPESLPNYADGRNFWVTVNPQSGSVAVNQVNPIADVGYVIMKQDADGVLKPDPYLNGAIAVSRELTH